LQKVGNMFTQLQLAHASGPGSGCLIPLHL
jgi:hypothetical protein